MKTAPSSRARLAATMLLLALSGTEGLASGPVFDGRAWTVGNQQRSARQSLTEYVLPGQTVDNWKELVTSTVSTQPVPIAPFVESCGRPCLRAVPRSCGIPFGRMRGP